MKCIKLFSTLLALLLITSLSAQRSSVKSTTTTFDKKAMPAQMIILDANREKVQDVWDQFWDERYDIDIDRMNREKTSVTYGAEAVKVNVISDKTMDIFSKISGVGKRTELSLALQYGYDMQLTSDNFPLEYRKAGALIDDFQSYFYTRYFGDQIAEVKEQLEDVRDDREDAAEDQSKAKKKISKWQDKIRKYEDRIAEARQEIGEEETTEMSKQDRIRELEKELNELQRMRSRYVR